jgi:hypothetical protein
VSYIKQIIKELYDVDDKGIEKLEDAYQLKFVSRHVHGKLKGKTGKRYVL